MIDSEIKVFRNLAIFPIRGADSLSRPYATLEEAMDSGLIVLHETGKVGELAADNRSDRYIFVMAGDIVRGGRQDRAMAEDVILRPNSLNVPLQSLCVEQSRWHQRGHESAAAFSRSSKMLANVDLKVAARARRSQHAVWEQVDAYQSRACESLGSEVRSSDSASSLELTLDNEKLRQTAHEYVAALQPVFAGKDDVVGFAFSVNGRVSTADSFGSAELFSKLRDKLLDSAASEALSQYDEQLQFAPPTPAEVTRLMAVAGSGAISTRTVGEVTVEKRCETAAGVLFQTFHVEAGTEEKVHEAVYHTQALANNGQRPHGSRQFRYGGFGR